MAQDSSPPPGSAAIDGDFFSVTVLPDRFEISERGANAPFCVADVDRLIDLGNVLAIAQDYAQGGEASGATARVVFVVRTEEGRREVFKTWGQPPQIRSHVHLPGLEGVHTVSAVFTTYGEHGQVHHRVELFNEVRALRSMAAAARPADVTFEPADGAPLGSPDGSS